MAVIFFLKRLIQSQIAKLSNIYQLAKLQQQYPNCHFYPGANISNTTFSEFNIIFNDVLIDSCNIGAHTYIQKKSAIFNADIGKFCSIASGVSIGPGIHKTDGVSTHPVFYLQNTPLVKKYSKIDLFTPYKRTFIGNDVWIGENAIIIDGINIGNGAIIAAGAVVTKSVEPYNIVGGVPAKIIKMRFCDEDIKKMNSSEWWNNSEEWLSKNHLLFLNIDRFGCKTK